MWASGMDLTLGAPAVLLSAFYSFWHSGHRGGCISILTMHTEELEYGILNGHKRAGDKGVRIDMETHCYICVYLLS